MSTAKVPLSKVLNPPNANIGASDELATDSGMDQCQHPLVTPEIIQQSGKEIAAHFSLFISPQSC